MSVALCLALPALAATAGAQPPAVVASDDALTDRHHDDHNDGNHNDDNHSTGTTSGTTGSTTTTTSSTTTSGTTSSTTTTSASSPVVVNSVESGVTVDSGGNVLIPDSIAVPVQLQDNAPENVGIRPPKNKTVTFTNQQASLSVTDLAGGALLVTRKVQGKTLVELASGTVRLEPGDATVPIPLAVRADHSVGVLLPKAGVAVPAVLLRRSDQGVAAFVEKGATDYRNVASGNGTAGAVGNGSLFAGETANFSADGTVQKIRLGSLDGDRNLPGDPLPNIANAEPGLLIPQLQGGIARLDGASLLDSIRAQIDAAFGVSAGSSIGFDAATGVVAYRLNGYEARFIGLGAPLIALAGFAASNPAQLASGTFALVDRGVQLTLASTLGYFRDFDAAVKAGDPAGKVTLKASGALWIDMGGSQYVTQPGALAAASGIVGQPQILVDADGLLSFRDGKGGVQALYPTLADAAALQQSLQVSDPGATLHLQGNGTAAADLAPGNYTLLPQYQLLPVPAPHANQRWWVEGGTVYYVLPAGKAQGVGIR